MARTHHKPEEIVAKLRQVEVLLAPGKTAAGAVRTIGVTEQSDRRWRSEYGGLKLDQVKPLEQLEQESGRLRKAAADLTLEKLMLKEAAAGKRLPSSGLRRACQGQAGRFGAVCLPGAGPAPLGAAPGAQGNR